MLRRTITTKSLLTLPVADFALNAGGVAPPSSVTLPKEKWLQMYKDMCIIRQIEGKCKRAYHDSHVRGFLHTQDGQEATTIGGVYAMRDGDTYSSSYRIHGWYYARTRNIEATIGEVLGRRCGASKGKGGSMHLYAPSVGIYGGQGIVGAQVPLGVGLAFAATYQSPTPKYASLAIFGDGAMNNGQVFEVANIAALWKLPVIFCLEDNGYAMGTAVNRGSCEPSLRKRVTYIPGMDFDGQDVAASYAAFATAREHVMAGKGPFLLHSHTHRFANHSMSDAGHYRNRDDVQFLRDNRDPIILLGKALKVQEPTLERELLSIDSAAAKEVEAAAEAVKATPYPALSELAADVVIGPNVVRTCQSTKYVTVGA